jgi:hypothetical protein
MARDFDPADHPRWPAEAPDSHGGEFRGSGPVAVAEASTAWADAVARSIARRIPTVDHIDDVDPEYRPGRWQRLTVAGRRDMYVQEMLPVAARMARKYQPDLADEDIRAQVYADAHEVVPDGATFYINGRHLVTIRGNRPVDQHVLLAELDRLIVDYPPPDDLRLGVREAAFFASPDDDEEGVTYAETVTGSATVGLSDGLFPDHLGVGSMDTGTGHKMPSAAHVTGLRYALTHEWGHVVTPKATEQVGLQAAFDVYGPYLSGYGRGKPAEAFAEAFAEWVLSRGVSGNLGVQGYAKRFGWKVPTHD